MRINLKDFGIGGLTGVLVCALIIAILAYYKSGSFTFGPISADFSTDKIGYVEKVKSLEEELGKYKQISMNLEKENRKLKNLLKSSGNNPIQLFEEELVAFNGVYGDIKTSGINMACDTDETRKYRKTMGEIALLEAKAKRLGIYEQYSQFFSKYKPGIVFHGACK